MYMLSCLTSVHSPHSSLDCVVFLAAGAGCRRSLAHLRSTECSCGRHTKSSRGEFGRRATGKSPRVVMATLHDRRPKSPLASSGGENFRMASTILPRTSCFASESRCDARTCGRARQFCFESLRRPIPFSSLVWSSSLSPTKVAARSLCPSHSSLVVSGGTVGSSAGTTLSSLPRTASRCAPVTSSESVCPVSRIRQMYTIVRRIVAWRINLFRSVSLDAILI